MKRNITWNADNLLIILSAFVIFLLITGDIITVPPWLHLVGRMHPVALHFPIVILISAALLDISNFKPKHDADVRNKYIHVLLTIGCVFAGATVIMGMLLSKEGGYDENVLKWHKWSGVSVFFLSYFVYSVRNNKWYKAAPAKFLSVMVLASILVGGHYGATLTHGENYILQPLASDNKVNIVMSEAELYDHVIKPILNDKCKSCHNSKKQKGNLILTDTLSILKGGKTGDLIVSGKPDQSLLIQRLNLPLESKKHMPPAGNNQLTTDEIALLYKWIKSSYSFKTKIAQLPPADSVSIAARSFLKSSGIAEKTFDFPEASAELITKLNNNYRTVVPISPGSPALSVSIFGKSAFTPESIKDLQAIKEQIIYLNVSGMPIQDEELKIIALFTNLKTLNLNFTEITGKGLSYLASLHNLNILSVSGTKIGADDIVFIKSLKSATNITLWNTKLTEDEIQELKRACPQTLFVGGFRQDLTNPVKLNSPQIVNDSSVFSDSILVELHHPVKGTALYYTIDGGDPDDKSAMYADKIPVKRNTVIKVIAQKKDWLKSDVSTFEFYKRTFVPDSFVLQTPLPSRFYANGEATFFDGQLGTPNMYSGKWLGISRKKLECLLEFRKPVLIGSIGLRTFVSQSDAVFPPISIEIWGGRDLSTMHLLKRSIPKQPMPGAKAYITILESNFRKQQIRYLKIIANPVMKIPNWNDNKGSPALLMTDEMFIN